MYRQYCWPYCQCNTASYTAERILASITIAAIEIQHCKSTMYNLYCGPYRQCNRARCTAEKLLVSTAKTTIYIQDCISTMYRLFCGPYCQCNSTRGKAKQTNGYYSNSKPYSYTTIHLQCIVFTVGLIVSATGPEVQQTDYLLL